MNENIIKKFEKLEKENKKYRIFNTSLIIILFSILIYGFQQKVSLPEFELPSIIEAEKFVLKGKNGKVAEFGLINEKDALLTFFEEGGQKIQLTMGVRNNKSFISMPGENSPIFYVSEINNYATMRLGMDDDKNSSFMEFDPNNYQPYISLKKGSQTEKPSNDLTYLTNNGLKVISDSLYMMYGKDFIFDTKDNKNKIVNLPGSYGISVYSVNNNNRMFYYSSGYDINAKNSYVEVYNPYSNSSASLKVIQNLPGLVGIKDNKLRYLMFTDENNKASLKIHDSEGKIRTVLGSESVNKGGKQEILEESNLLFFSKEGNLIQQIPEKK